MLSVLNFSYKSETGALRGDFEEFVTIYCLMPLIYLNKHGRYSHKFLYHIANVSVQKQSI